MGVYDEDIQTAFELIQESGEKAKLVRFASVVPDPDKPWDTNPPAREEQDIVAVFLNFNMQGSGQTYWNGTEVHSGDKKVLVAAQGNTWPPNLQGQIVRENGSVWKIENIKTLDPNGQLILHTIQARQ